MKLSTREKWLIAIGGPLLILIIAELALLRPLRSSTNDLAREMQARGDRDQWHGKLRIAQAEAAELQKEIESVQQSMLAGQTFKLDHQQALKEVSELCTVAGLSLMASAIDTQPVLTGRLQAAVPLLTQQSQGIVPEAWRIDVQGTYAQVQTLLDSLARSGPLIVPLSIAMKVDEEGLQPSAWVLTLWL